MLPVAIIGAGPIGLTAAALLHQRRIPSVVFELGDRVGASVREWGHVRLFSPWSMNVDAAAVALLRDTGWTAPDPRQHPTGSELVVRLLEPLAATAALAPAIRTDHRVIAVTRHGVDKLRSAGRTEAPFNVVSEHAGSIASTLARVVIDASGTWRRPNPLGSDGMPAAGEAASSARISSGLPDVLGADRDRFVGRRVAVVGSGHSARHVVGDLARLANQHRGGEVVWVTRRGDAAALLPDRRDDVLAERARLVHEAYRLVTTGEVRLVTGFGVHEVVAHGDGVVLAGLDRRRLGPFDEVVAATGFRPDNTTLAELRVDLDPVLESSRALAELIDPAVHDCSSVPPHGVAELAHPDPGVFVVGAKSYGRAPTFLLATGYQQVRAVVAELAGERPPEVAAVVACGGDSSRCE